MKVNYLNAYCAAMKHPNKWTITELINLKNEFMNILFFAKLANGVTPAKVFTLLLAFQTTLSE